MSLATILELNISPPNLTCRAGWVEAAGANFDLGDDRRGEDALRVEEAQEVGDNAGVSARLRGVREFEEIRAVVLDLFEGSALDGDRRGRGPDTMPS